MVGGVSLGSPGTDGGLRAELSGGGGEGLLGVRLGAGVLFMMRARESWEVWQRGRYCSAIVENSHKSMITNLHRQ